MLWKICGSLQISSVISQWTSLAVSKDIFGSLWTSSAVFGHLRQCSDIFGCLQTSSTAFGHLRQLSDIFLTLRKSWNNPELLENGQKKPLWYNKHRPNIDISPFRAWFVCLWEKNNVTTNFLMLVLKWLKINCLMLYSQKY